MMELGILQEYYEINKIFCKKKKIQEERGYQRLLYGCWVIKFRFYLCDDSGNDVDNDNDVIDDEDDEDEGDYYCCIYFCYCYY